MFSNLSWSEISFAIVTPSFVTTGLVDLSITTYLPRGPSVILTVSATLLTPARSDLRASSLKISCFDDAMGFLRHSIFARMSLNGTNTYVSESISNVSEE